MFQSAINLLQNIAFLVAFFGVALMGNSAGDEINRLGGHGTRYKYGSVFLAFYLTWAISRYMVHQGRL